MRVDAFFDPLLLRILRAKQAESCLLFQKKVPKPEFHIHWAVLVLLFREFFPRGEKDSLGNRAKKELGSRSSVSEDMHYLIVRCIKFGVFRNKLEFLRFQCQS